MANRVLAAYINGKLQPLPDGDRGIDAGGNIATAGINATTKVRLATTGNIADLAAGAPDTVDTQTVSVGDRILVKDQTTQTQNGIYVVDVVGTGSDGEWSRAEDFDENAEINGLVLVQVVEGSVAGNADTTWALNSIGGLTIGSSNIIFVKTATYRNRVAFETEFTLDGQNALTGASFGEFIIPKAGYLVGATIYMDSARTAGTIAVEPAKNGTGLTPTGLDLLIDGTATQTDTANVAYGTTNYNFSAGDRLSALVTSTSFTPVPNTGRIVFEFEEDL